MKKLFLSLVFYQWIILFSTAYAQMPYLDTAWVDESPIVGTGVYYHTSTIVVSGKLVTTGRVLNGSGDTDIITTKYNSNGTVNWSQTSSGNFTGGADDYGVELIANAAGDITVIGAVKNNTTNYDYRVLRYNASGTLLWSYDWNRTGVNGDDIPTGLVAPGLAGGPPTVCGGSEASNGFSDFAVLSLNSSGVLNWVNYYNHTSNLHDAATKITFSPTGCNVSGASANAINDWDIATVKFHPSTGAIVSTTRTNTSATMVEARAMTTDSLKNVYITGYGVMGSDKDIQTIKLDSSLNIVWQAYYEGTYNDVGNDVTVDASGNVYITGYSELADGRTKAILVKYASNGDTLFTEYYGNVEESRGAKGQKIVIDDNSHVLIAGTTEDYDTIQQMYFAEYDGTGALQLATEYTSYGINDEAFDIDVDADSVYITGLSSSLSGRVQSVIKFVRLQDVNPSYFYLNGEKSFWCQQPGMYSFSLYDGSQYVGYDPAIVEDSVYYAMDGTHYVYFKNTATEGQINSVISDIEADPKFSKEFMVATLTRNNDEPYEKEYHAALNDYISILFEDPGLTITEIDSFAALYETTVVFAPNGSIEEGRVYILQPNRMRTIYDWENPTLTMDLARDMQENDSLNFVKAVDPGMFMFRPNDPDDSLYTEQWWAEDALPFLCNGTEVFPVSIDLDCAWNYENEFGPGEYYSGENIVVAVIDFHGVEFSHPDCNGMYGDHGFVSPTMGAVVVPFYNDLWIGENEDKVHGQNVCGIIGARIDNNEGTAGVAHNATILPCLMKGTTDNFNALITKIREEQGPDEVDVINMSLGFGGMTLSEAMGFTFYTNLQDCYLLGRPDPLNIEEPRGMVLVAAAGNQNINVIQFPANAPFVLSVGATNPWDMRKTAGDDFDPSGYTWGSSYSTNLDVAAPGICVWSTDFTDSNPNFCPGCEGYATGNYNLFEGTSAASPIVSGIAALVLEKDSMLTAEEVYDAIRYSCEKVGGYAYSNSWETGRCLELGYGRVNACMALEKVDELSVEESTSTSFSVIHPNPVNGLFSAMISGTDNYIFTLVNVMGEVVYRSEVNSENQFEVDMRQFSNGIYFLHVIDLNTQETQTSKIIKQ